MRLKRAEVDSLCAPARSWAARKQSREAGPLRRAPHFRKPGRSGGRPGAVASTPSSSSIPHVKIFLQWLGCPAMASVCFYFQVHQPFRLRRSSVFDTDRHYFDDHKNAEIVRKVAGKCYLPANKLLLEMIRGHEGRFRVAFSLTGLALEQFQHTVPEVIEIFQALGKTDCVEFLDETHYHSLSFLYSREEFRAQVELHRAKIKELFDQEPRIFRNTELIYNNDLAQFVSHMGYDGVITEGADQVLGFRSPNHVYQPPHLPKMRMLLKNYRLSDDIAFRFSNRGWEQWP